MNKFIKEQLALVLIGSAFILFLVSVLSNIDVKFVIYYFAAILIFLGVRGVRGMNKKRKK